VNLFWTVGTASTVIAPVLDLLWAAPPTAVPARGGSLGSGIVLRTEVTTIWLPRALRDLARLKAGKSGDRFPEDLKTYLGPNWWETAWYAFCYRGHQVNGR
jgi:hypothetical protein